MIYLTFDHHIYLTCKKSNIIIRNKNNNKFVSNQNTSGCIEIQQNLYWIIQLYLCVMQSSGTSIRIQHYTTSFSFIVDVIPELFCNLLTNFYRILLDRTGKILAIVWRCKWISVRSALWEIMLLLEFDLMHKYITYGRILQEKGIVWFRLFNF